jgi:hypothetical protein
MSHARHSYLVADSSKFGQIRPAAFARLDAFERVLTDDGLSAADRARLQAIAGERSGSGPSPPRSHAGEATPGRPRPASGQRRHRRRPGKEDPSPGRRD